VKRQVWKKLPDHYFYQIRAALPCALTLLVSLLPLKVTRAQMVTGQDMPGYEKTFGVRPRQQHPIYGVQLMRSTVPGNILWPGDKATFAFRLKNNTPTPIQTAGKVDVITYGTKGLPGDIWKPNMFKIADIGSIPIAVDLPANGTADLDVSPTIPERFGAYALIADLGASGRQFVTSCVRTFKATPGRVQFPKLGCDISNPEVLERLGCKSIRYSIGYKPTTDGDFREWFEREGEKLKRYQHGNVAIIVEFGIGGPQPLGQWRPHLDDKGVMLDTKSDAAWLPSSDQDFKKEVNLFASTYGWPKGPVTAIKFMNEPWEGLSISGWGADMPRYREIYTAMAEGVEAARRDAGVKVLIGGTDSSSNTFDKLFGDGSDKFLKWLDFVSIHYQGMAPPSTVKAWVNRKSPYGRVKIWDTESWVANTDDRVAAVLATNMSTGHDRAVGIYGGNIAEENEVRLRDASGKEQTLRIVNAFSVAASVGAAQHFLGERNFKEMLFKNGLPWVMVFHGLSKPNGQANEEDGTVVVVGDIGDEFGHNYLLFRTARGLAEIKHKAGLRRQLAALPASATVEERQKLVDAINLPETLSDASMTLGNMGGRVRAFDFYGNPVPAVNGKIVVPLDHRGFYLRGDGRAGSFQAVQQAVRASYMRGIEPLATVVHDLTAPVGQGGTLRLSLTNVLNRPVQGKLDLKIAGLKLSPATQTLHFAPNETKQVVLNVTGKPNASNTYALALRFNAGADGTAVYQEDIHANVIAHRTIQVDGNLDDWKGVLPQTISVVGQGGPTLTEAAWLPFKTFDQSVKTGFANGYMAYDKNYFYFAAKVADATDDGGTLRFATRDDDQFYYPEVSYKRNDQKTLQKHDTTWATNIDEQLLPYALQLPDSDTKRSQGAWESTANAFAIDLSLPKDRRTQFSLYFLDWDEGERRDTKIQMIDRTTNKVLDERDIRKFGHGRYVVYELSGDVRVQIKSNMWWKGSVSGLFFDPVAGDATANGTGARFIRYDDTTGGKWKGVYGADGYNVIGATEKYPAYAQVTVPEQVDLTPFQWPAGVRPYSYRKDPILPSGNAPGFDNIQIAFNVLPPEQKDWYPYPPGTMPHYIGYRDTDYEYALNQVAPQYGGGTEIWRLQVPGMPHKHFYPRQGKSPFDGPVKNGKLVVKRNATTRFVECAIPWSEIPAVKRKLDAGQPIKFSFRVNDNSGGPTMELSKGRSVAKQNGSFHVDWQEHWANELEFGWGK